MNIRTRLACYFLLVIVSCVAIPSGIAIKLAYDSSVETFSTNKKIELDLVSNIIQGFFDDVLKDVDFLAEIKQLPDLDASVTNFTGGDRTGVDVNQMGRDEYSVFQVFDNYKKNHPSIAYAYLGTKWGGHISSPLPIGDLYRGFDPLKRPWYKNALTDRGKVVFGEPYGFDGLLYLSFSRTYEHNDEIRGVIAIDLTIDTIVQVINNIAQSGDNFAIAATSKNTILADPTNEEHILKSFDEVGGDYQQFTDLEDGIALISLQGLEYFVVAKTIPAFGWRIFILEPKNTVLARAHQAVISVLISGIILTLILLALAWWRTTSIVSPINNVADGLRGVAQGGASIHARLDYTQNDELGELVHWFNAFLASTGKQVSAIQTEAQVLDTVSSHVRDISDNISQSSQRQQSTVQEITDAFSYLVETAKNVIDSCDEADAHLSTSRSAIEKGRNAIGSNVVCVNTLRSTIETNATEIEKLAEAGEQINGILENILGIAEQTNLLALNAAIEAARAGDQGRGFAVVADEVRALAKRTQESTAEINRLLEQLHHQTEQVSSKMDLCLSGSHDAGEASVLVEKLFSQIQETVNQIANTTQQVSTIAKEQALSASTIEDQVGSIRAETMKVVSLSSDVLQSADNLHEASDKLGLLVEHFEQKETHSVAQGDVDHEN